MALSDHQYRGEGWQVPVLGILYVVRRGIIESMFRPYVWASPLLSTLVAVAFGRWLWRRGRRLNADAPRWEDWRRDRGFSLRRRAAHAYWFVLCEYWGIVFALLSMLIDTRARAPHPPQSPRRDGDGQADLCRVVS